MVSEGVAALAGWILERENVRVAKEAGAPKPWSNDSVFQRTYFCNVRREDDRVTRWIRENWSPEKIGWHEYEYAMCLARFINRTSTLERLTFSYGGVALPNTTASILHNIEGPVWGNAYVFTTSGRKMDKIDYLCQEVLPAVYNALGHRRWVGYYMGPPATLGQRHGQLMQLPGLASFMAAQVVADLKNTPGHPLYIAPDWNSWSAPGPGSLRGLGWIFGEKVNASSYLTLIAVVAEELQALHSSAAALLATPDRIGINMQDLQNCLCEFDKYCRVKNGTGRSKRSYPGI